MANRFYFAPIDPGYGAFGSAIAAGMGQAMSAVAAGKEREREEERYRQRTELEQRRHDEQLARERAAIEAQNIREGRPTVEPTGTIASGPMGMPIFVPRSPVATATGATGSFPQPAPAPTIPEATGAIGLTAGVAGLTGPAPAGVASGGAAGATEVAGSPVPPAPSPISSARQFLGIPENAYLDPRINRYVQFDPSKSETAQTEAFKYRQETERLATKRAEIQSVIARVLEDGKIDWKTEAPLLEAWGLKPKDLEDPAKAEEKALAKETREHTRALELVEARGKADAANRQRELTANQARQEAAKTVQGRVTRLYDEGKDSYDILQEVLADPILVAAAGGEDIIYSLVGDVVVGKEAISRNNALQAATQEMSDAGISPLTDPNYQQKLDARVAQIQNQARTDRQEAARRERNRGRPGFRSRSADQPRSKARTVTRGTSSIVEAREPAAAPPETTSGAPVYGGVRSADLPAGIPGSLNTNAADSAFVNNFKRQNPRATREEVWQALNEDRHRRIIPPD